MPHPIDRAILATPQLSMITVILKIINVTLKRLQGKYEKEYSLDIHQTRQEVYMYLWSYDHLGNCIHTLRPGSEREMGGRGERESHHKLRTMRCWYNRHLHNVFDVDWLWWLHRELKTRPFLPYRPWRYRIFRQWSDRYDEIEEAYFHSWRWLDLWWWTLRLRSSQKLTDSADWGKFTPLAI